MKTRLLRSGFPGLRIMLELALLIPVLAGCPTGGDDPGGGNNTDGGDDGTVYTFTIDPAITGAVITAEPARGTQHTEITLTIEGDGALVPGSLKYTYNGQERLINTSTRKFTLPAADVTVCAEFSRQYAVSIDPSLAGILGAVPASGAVGAEIVLSVTDPSKHIQPETLGYDAGDGLVSLKGAMKFTLPAADVTVKGEAEAYADLIRRMVKVNGRTVDASIGASNFRGESRSITPAPRRLPSRPTA